MLIDFIWFKRDVYFFIYFMQFNNQQRNDQLNSLD